MRDLRGKVVLVTGAAHGIGKATAKAFAREGARLVLVDIHQQRLDETVNELREAGCEVVGIQADLRRRNLVYDMVDRAIEETGAIDVLVNNAGIVFTGKFEDLSEQEIEDTLNVNLYAPIWAVRRALPHMLARDSGHIVNVASALGKVTNPFVSVYCATKFGVIGFTDTLYQELRDTGVGITTVNPGWITSGMFKGAKRLSFVKWRPPEFVGDSIVEAVKLDRVEINRPRIMWLGGFLRALLGPRILWYLWRLGKADKMFSRVVGYD